MLWSYRRSWQHRLVYRVQLATTTHGRVDAHHHVVVRREHVEEAGFLTQEEQVRAFLPLTWRPKELLLNLSPTSSSGEPEHLLTRADVSALQAGIYLDLLLATWIEVEDGEAIWDLVEAVARFMPRRVRAVAELTETSSESEAESRLRDADVLADFVPTETGVGVTTADVPRWAGRLRYVESRLSMVAPWPPSSESSSETFVLALSELEVESLDQLDAAVELYRWLVLTLSACQEGALLELLARLGREWTVVLDTLVQLNRPMSVTMADDRPLRTKDSEKDVLYMPVPVEDGESLHVETQLSDASALLKDVKLLAPDRETQLPLSDDVRETHDRHAVYLSAPVRPTHGLLRIHIGLTSDVQRTNLLVFALSVAALVLATLVNNTADVLALLVIPATLAVSVVQVRDSTSIVRSLTSRARLYLFGVATLLWPVAGLRLLIRADGQAGLLDLIIHLRQAAS